MAFVAVVTNTEKPLMPTSPYRARKLLASGRAKIYSHRPFAIMILDRADGKVKKGKELTNRRINRNRKKDHENLRPFRGRKVSKGKVSIRRGRPQIKPGSLVEVNGEILQVHGTHRKDHKLKNGMISMSINVEFASPARGGKKSASLRKCKLIKPSYNTGWIKI